MTDKPNMIELDKPERKRTYVYPSGMRLEYLNVTHVCVRPSGTHRLNLADGRKVIVNPGWIAVELDMDEWTF